MVSMRNDETCNATTVLSLGANAVVGILKAVVLFTILLLVLLLAQGTESFPRVARMRDMGTFMPKRKHQLVGWTAAPPCIYRPVSTGMPKAAHIEFDRLVWRVVTSILLLLLLLLSGLVWVAKKVIPSARLLEERQSLLSHPSTIHFFRDQITQ